MKNLLNCVIIKFEMKKTLSGTPVKKQGKSVNWQVEQTDSNEKSPLNNYSSAQKDQSPPLRQKELAIPDFSKQT